MIAPWPLTGRTAQLEELGRHYRDGSRSGVLLHGPAGVGKTRLAEEALRLAERGGRRVERAVGHPAAREIPLGALAHLLPADLTHELGLGEDERTALFHAARAELRRLAGDDRLVLLVDDIDLLDDTSVAVLVPLIMSRTVFLVGTVRTGRTPSPQLTVLHRDGHLVRMEIGPLDPEELGALLHRALDGPVSERARTELARLSGGNLQVVTELVRAARERGALAEVNGAWELIGSLPTSAALEELVAEHLAGVDPTGLAVLERLAVCGRFGLVDLERVAGAATLEALEQSGLIVTMTSERRMALRLAHPLYGEVLRARIPPLRLRRIQAELADIVEAHGARRREDVLQVAMWRTASGGFVSADHLSRAVRLALAGHDPQLALRLMEAADNAGLAPTEHAELLVEAHSMQGSLADLERVVAASAEEDWPEIRRARIAKRLADARFYIAGDLNGALGAYETARERFVETEAIVAVDAGRASLLAGAGRPMAALSVIEAMPDIESPQTRVEIAGAMAASLLSVGRFGEARAVARQAAADHAALPGRARRGIAQHLVNEAHALAYAGNHQEARALLEPAAARAQQTGAMGAWVWIAMALAEVARDSGRGHEAVRRFAEVAAVADEAGQHAALVWAHVGVAQGHLLLGHCAEAAAALVLADEIGDSPVATSIGTRERARAWLDACRGDLLSARRRIREAIVPVHEDGVLIFEVALLHDLVRFGVADEAVDRLEALATVVEGPQAATNAAHARAVVDADVVLLAQVVDQYEAFDSLAWAAEAAAELADLHRARDEARLATAARQRAAMLAERAGDLRTPALARGAGVEPLTVREREVALMAAGGRSSRAIADHLGMSTRTVDTHLARVYRKLGIGGRAELAEALEVSTT